MASWAEKRGWPRLKGHHAGAENMRRMVAYLNVYPVKYSPCTFFLTENWADVPVTR
jgi:undecaprenyl diphosphate synthase